MAKARSQPSNGRTPDASRSVKSPPKGKPARAPRTIRERRVHPIQAMVWMLDLKGKEIEEGAGINRTNLYKYIRRDPKWHVTPSLAKRLAKFSGLPEKFFLGHDIVIRATYR